MEAIFPFDRYNQYPRSLFPTYNRRSFPLTAQNLGIAEMIGAGECPLARVDFAGIAGDFQYPRWRNDQHTDIH